MSDNSSFRFEMTISSSPSTIASAESNGSENTIMTRARRRARQQEELLRQQELIQQEQPPSPPAPAPAPVSALTQRTDNTSAPQNLNAEINSANEAPEPQATVDTIANIITDDGLNSLSLAIRNNNTGGMVVPDQMKKIISISKKYKNLKDKTWSVFLKVVVLHGGPTLATLATTTITNPDGSEINALVQAVQGEPSPAKKNILNYILTIHVLRYNRMKQKKLHKQKGDHYEPGTMVNQIKALAQEFDCVSGKNISGACKYQFFKDFKYPGGFISILQNIWFNEMTKDPLFFGKKPFAANFDPQAYEKVQEAIKTGNLDLDNPRDLLLLAIFAQGFCLWLRGMDEQHTRKWIEYTFAMTADKVEKAMIDLSNDKTYHPWNVCDLVKTREKLFILETPDDDPFKPVAVLKKMKAIADEHNFEHVLFHQNTTTGELTKVTAKDMPILLDELGAKCGWNVKTTGHGLRQGGVTKGAKSASTMAEQKMVSGHARHANTAITQAIYNKPSEEQKEQFALIRAGHRTSSSASNENENLKNNTFLSQMTFADAKTVLSNNDNFSTHSNYFDNDDRFPDEITFAPPPPAAETISQKKIDDLENENIKLKKSNSELTSENTNLICDFQRLQAENQSLKTENQELNQELSEINIRYEKVDGKLDKRKLELYAAKADIEDLDRRKRKLKKSLAETEERFKAERKKRKKAEKKLENRGGCVVM